MKKSKVLLIFPQKVSVLEYLIAEGHDIRRDDILENNYKYSRDIHYGWRKGFNDVGYLVEYLDRPSYIVPAFIRKLSPTLYVKFLKVFERIPARILAYLVYNLAIIFKVLYTKPDFVMFYTNKISPVVIRVCTTINCVTLEYNGIPPNQGEKYWRKTVKRNADYILSCFDISKWPNLIIRQKFYKLELIPAYELYGDVDFNSDSRFIDINLVGSFNDTSFLLRSTIMNCLLQLDNIDQLSISIHSDATSFKCADEYRTLLSNIQGPVYGKNYIDTLKSSKLAIVIPSDDHIQIGDGMPSRIFQNAASGCMQLVYRCDAVGDLFEDKKEIILFDDADDLAEKIVYYLEYDEDRVKIARNAQKRLYKQFSPTSQIKKMLKFVEQEKL